MEVNKINLVFPNQLFENSPLDLNNNKSYIIEHDIFFKNSTFINKSYCYIDPA